MLYLYTGSFPGAAFSHPGFGFFYLGGSIQFFIFLSSILFVLLFRLKLGLILGVAGCMLMGVNLFFPSIPSVVAGGEVVTGYSISFGFYIQFIIWILFCVTNLLLFLGKSKDKSVNFRKIKETILDLGTQYANLEVREISEACDVNKYLIIDTIQDMIAKQEIYAEYIKSSKTVAFNKQVNIEEIDNLMAMYQEWEEKEQGKI